MDCEFYFSSHACTHLSNGMQNEDLRAMERGTLLHFILISRESRFSRCDPRVTRRQRNRDAELLTMNLEIARWIDESGIFAVHPDCVADKRCTARRGRERERNYIARAPDVVAIQPAR